MFLDPNLKVHQTQEKRGKNILKITIKESHLQITNILYHKLTILKINKNIKTEVLPKKFNNFHPFKQTK